LLRDHAQAQRRLPEVDLPAAPRAWMPCACDAAVPPRHAVGVLQCPHDACAAAWPPANAAILPDIQALDSTVGCDAGPEISARNLCADKSAIPAAGPWRAHRLRWYAESVPWEVMTPLGSPRRISLILLGHSALAPLSLSLLQPTTADEPLSPDVRTRTWQNRQDITTRQTVARRRTQGRRLSRNALGSKDTNEGAQVDPARTINEGHSDSAGYRPPENGGRFQPAPNVCNPSQIVAFCRIL